MPSNTNAPRRKNHKSEESIGKKYHRLTVLEIVGRTEIGIAIVYCRCDCGNQHRTLLCSIKNGRTTSCGCALRTHQQFGSIKHGQSTHTRQTKAHRAWACARGRITNPKNPKFKYYGGRGIKMCTEWWAEFSAFYRDMGDPPSPQHTLDRIDVNGNYEPSNCRWATRAEQSRNRRVNVLTMEKATEIRRMRAEKGWGPSRIASALGVTKSAVGGVIYHGCWS